MPLLGQAAMLLAFDIAAEALSEHDDWHTHEHLPERLAIPGFLRSTRWVALQGQPRYLVLYEVDRLETLASAAYLERLNHPTPWTAKMMPHYRGMTRGLCSVVQSAGLGLGHFGLLTRFASAPGAEARLSEWLASDIVARLPQRPGLGSVHLLRGALAAQMTNEQRIRGADGGIDWALLVTGYSQEALAALRQSDLDDDRLYDHGAAGADSALYRSDYTLSASELRA
ncbi:MAG: hypothetical protein K8R60_07735 [Burkholderiales bacterium]|nr:hypothetical protein [Burkholderiales bacterium]